MDQLTLEKGEIKKRIDTLSSLIKKYQASYYAGQEEISDKAFDDLWDELKSLDPDNPVLKSIGHEESALAATKDPDLFNSSINSDFPKVRHLMMMGSQEKCATEDEFLSWVKKHPYKEYLVEYKLDGASIELQYTAGIFRRAVTRGDGVTGDDISSNALYFTGLVREIPGACNGEGTPFTGSVRGEVLMTHENMKEHFPDGKNCRNAAAGLMKRLDGVAECKYLSIVTYDAQWSGEGRNPYFQDEEEKITFLKKSGFETTPLKIFSTAQEVLDYRIEIDKKRKDLNYDIDGLVIKAREIDRFDAARPRPQKQVAFKFTLDEARTTLLKVEWSTNGATYTPIAIFDPVLLNGTTVRRASLVNPDTIKSLGVRLGSTIVVTKRGEIIPKVERVVQGAKEVGNAAEITLPTVCEVCGALLINGGTRLFCPNRLCSKRVVHQLHKWVATLNILEIGDVLLEKLTSSGLVQSITDLYKLTEATLRPFFLQAADSSEKPSLGAKRVLESLEQSKTIPLAAFIAGFDIEGVGVLMCEKVISAGHDTLSKIFSLTVEDVASIAGFADIMAKTFVDGIKENRVEMESLSNSVITIRNPSSGSLKGVTFCFTGELHSMKRLAAEELVKQNGGSSKTSVTKDLTYLVTNNPNSNSAKNRAAREYGVKVITEETFLSLVNPSC